MGVKVITRHRNVNDLIQWLEYNVGPVLHSQPMNFWHGLGWHLRTYTTIRYHGNHAKNEHQWEVEFDGEQKATLFALVWP